MFILTMGYYQNMAPLQTGNTMYMSGAHNTTESVDIRDASSSITNGSDIDVGRNPAVRVIVVLKVTAHCGNEIPRHYPGMNQTLYNQVKHCYW